MIQDGESQVIIEGIERTMMRSRLLSLIRSYIPKTTDVKNDMNYLLTTYYHSRVDTGHYKEIVCTHADTEFYQRVEEQFDRLIHLSNIHGFQIILVIIPKPEKYEDPLWDRYEFTPIHDMVRKTSEDRGIPVHDLLNDVMTFPAITVSSTDPTDLLHYSEFGHRVIAISIYNYIIENNMINDNKNYNKMSLTTSLNKTKMMSKRE